MTKPTERQLALRTSLGVAVVLAAGLLFVVQPLIASHLLPWFGGTPATWSACVLFFQILVLGGYGLAHVLVRWLSPLQQRLAHGGLMALALGVLVWTTWHWPAPILPGVAWRPDPGEDPALEILFTLAAAVGLPGLVVASTSPLTQAWLVSSRATARWTRVYALSNLASLGGLLAYPLLLEPFFDHRVLAGAWAGGFALLVMALGVCSVVSLGDAHTGGAASELPPENVDRQARAGSWIVWLVLPALSSVMLLAGTNKMCQEVAAVPLLWVVPLALYLISWVITFEWQGLYRRDLFLAAMVVMAVLTCWALANQSSSSVIIQIVIYSALVFVVSMICHGELVAARPSSERLTSFYLLVALGSVIGGAAVSLLAPSVLNGYWELHLALLAGLAVALFQACRDDNSRLSQGHPAMVGLTLAAVAGVLALMAAPSLDEDWQVALGAHPWLAGMIFLGLAAAVAGLVALMARRQFVGAVRVVGSAAVVFTLAAVLVLDARAEVRSSVHSSRSFFGVLRVLEENVAFPDSHRLRLLHGAITHGFQYFDPELKVTATVYYGAGSGVAAAMDWPISESRPRSIGAVGMGVGTIAAHGRAGDRIRFYELDPEVVDLAVGPDALFSYVADSAAEVSTVVGDGRLSLETELAAGGSNSFDLLIVDAFSSDSIPVHLLTLEAIELYLAHLADDGVIAFHLTNRHLDLSGLALAAGEHLGLSTVLVEAKDQSEVHLPNKWMLFSRDQSSLETEAIKKVATPTGEAPAVRLWTDSYSNLIGSLRYRGR